MNKKMKIVLIAVVGLVLIAGLITAVIVLGNNDQTNDTIPKEDTGETDTVVTLSSESGLVLTFDLSNKTYILSGTTEFGGVQLASYSLKEGSANGYRVEENILSLDDTVMTITALHDLASTLAGDFEVSFTVTKESNNSISIVLSSPLNPEPLGVFKSTEEEAKMLGIN